MGDQGTEGRRDETPGPFRRQAITVQNQEESGGRVGRESPTTGVWRKPGAGAVPTRPIVGLFDFSSDHLDEARTVDACSESTGEEAQVAEARRRAFGLLDEWLAWFFVSDDDSGFIETDGSTQSQPYRFELDDTLADPRDVLRYAHRGSGFFL